MTTTQEQALFDAIAGIEVTSDGILNSESWPSEEKKNLNFCLCHTKTDLAAVRTKVEEKLFGAPGGDKQLRERVVRQMLGRSPDPVG